MNNKELICLRTEIDDINLQLLKLLNRRAEVVQEIGKQKAKQGMNKFDPERERLVIEMILERHEGPFEASSIENIFKQIFRESLELQNKN
jgi:3-deoxy-7-phosphoheptulonate synthase/chorismate mutase